MRTSFVMVARSVETAHASLAPSAVSTYTTTAPRVLINILNSNTTHSHPMSLEVHKPADTNQALQSCQICRVPVKGLAYHCKDCNFWVHPLCVSPDNSRHSQQVDHTTVPPASGFVQAGQRIGEQVVAGVMKTVVCDKLKGEMNESSPLVGSSVHVSGATEVLTASSDAGGWLETISSWFESSDS